MTNYFCQSRNKLFDKKHKQTYSIKSRKTTKKIPLRKKKLFKEINSQSREAKSIKVLI